MKYKKAFNNFIDFGSYIQKNKEKNKQLAFEKLSKGVFVESLEHLTHVQLQSMMPANNVNDTDYVFEHRNDIFFENIEMITHSYRYVITIIYSIYMKHKNEKINLTQHFEITNNGFNNGFQLETFGDLYLRKEFIEKYKLNNYTEQEFLLIQIYKKIFNDNSTTDIIPHMIKEKNVIIINNDFKYITEYELYVRKKIHAGLSRMLLKFASTTATKKGIEYNFIERLTSLLENDYTLPLLDKKLNELTEDDITVLKMSVI